MTRPDMSVRYSCCPFLWNGWPTGRRTKVGGKGGVLVGASGERETRGKVQALGSTKFGSLVCVTSFFDGDGMARWHMAPCLAVCVCVSVARTMMGGTGWRAEQAGAKRDSTPAERGNGEEARRSGLASLPPAPCGNDLKGMPRRARHRRHSYAVPFSFFVNSHEVIGSTPHLVRRRPPPVAAALPVGYMLGGCRAADCDIPQSSQNGTLISPRIFKYGLQGPGKHCNLNSP